MTSRRETALIKQFDQVPSFEINPQDVNDDIKFIVTAKVSKISRLSSQPQIREDVIRRISGGHNGMFLWAYLMLKELKYCNTNSQVRELLDNLPGKLEPIYQAMLRRLHSTLSPGTIDLCKQVLMWVVCAVRPLRLEELHN